MPARASAANQAPLRGQLAFAEWSRSVVIVPHPPLRAGLSLRLLGAQHIGGSLGMPYPAPTRVSFLSDKYLGDWASRAPDSDVRTGLQAGMIAVTLLYASLFPVAGSQSLSHPGRTVRLV